MTVANVSTLSDAEVVAKTLDGEAGNQGYRGQKAVANVIMRRAQLGWQGEKTLRGVCLHPKQFSCWDIGPDLDRIMAGTNPQCMSLALLALANNLPDITNGADSYQVRGTNAYWSQGLTPVASIGAHDFYITRKA